MGVKMNNIFQFTKQHLETSEAKSQKAHGPFCKCCKVARPGKNDWLKIWRALQANLWILCVECHYFLWITTSISICYDFIFLFYSNNMVRYSTHWTSLKHFLCSHLHFSKLTEVAPVYFFSVFWNQTCHCVWHGHVQLVQPQGEQ